MKVSAIRITRGLLTWVGLGVTLLAGGFLVDGSTEIGHHAFLILGGVCIGCGIRMEVKP